MLVKVKEFETFLHNCVKDNPKEIGQVIAACQVPVNPDSRFFIDIKEGKQLCLNSYRTVEPTRLLYYFTREQVEPFNRSDKKRIIVGVKACDLSALKLLDKALLEDDFQDPSYKYWRENTILISSDCQEFSSVCHCTIFDGKPWAEDGFDVNLSKVNDSYNIITGSSKGDFFIELLKRFVNISEQSSINQEKVKIKRQDYYNKLKEKNEKYTIESYSHLRAQDIKNWNKESKKCIGCGACTNICGICYCLILNDESTDDQFIKVRSTDSCQLNGYARVAGGDTPRPQMYDRFRNRYLCKFDYVQSKFNTYGCTGCGRCIEACPAEIDIREVVKNVKVVV